ncbi:MAG: PAS domain S-box protein [Longimicrobiales bacterium]|nr:PAS domain S-box protein [Longimicrobiales bacterium]
MPSPPPHRDALRIALVYAVLAVLWIVGTDLLVRIWISDLQQEMWIESLKGVGFSAVTGGLLYTWVRRRLGSREEELRNLRTLNEQVPDMIFRLRLRPRLEFEYVSQGAVNLAGFTPGEVYEDLDRVLDAVHPEDRSDLERFLADPDSISDSVELRWIHKDGHTVWVEFRVSRHLDDSGHVDVVEGIARDITERRREEERNALLATAVDAVGEAIYMTDTAGRIHYVNPAFTEITGYTADEAGGNTPRILNSGRQEESFYRKLWGTITAGRTFRGQMVNRRKNGTLYDQEATITPVRKDGEQITHYVAVARDVTLRNEMERQLHRSYKMDTVGQMAAGISHDFRNLLNVIQVNAELLEDGFRRAVGAAGDWAEEGLTQAEEIESAARRGAELVTDLLTLAKEKELDLRTVDVGGLLGEAERAVQAVLPDSVRCDVGIEENLSVKADRSAFQHILLNLATNAGHAMPHGGTLSIRAEGVQGPLVEEAAREAESPDPAVGKASYVRVTVADTGTGIDRETLARIFDPFFTTKEEGTGLGLAMVRSLVHQHGGFLRARSELGKGTTFELYFPRTRPAAGDTGVEEELEPERATLPGGTERILLVEDEAPLREVAERALSRLGYEVGSAYNGQDALEKIEAADRSWDLVLTDLIMPEMGGVDLHETVQNRGFPLPFLFMSGYGAEEHALVSNPDRFRVFLQKPWTVEDLAWKVREALDARL